MVWHAILACREVCFAPDIRRNLHEKWGLVLGKSCSKLPIMRYLRSLKNSKNQKKDCLKVELAHFWQNQLKKLFFEIILWIPGPTIHLFMGRRHRSN